MENIKIKKMKKLPKYNLMPNLAVVGLVALTGVFPMAVAAQESADGEIKSALLEEIVITARRTEERLADVPVAVSAFNDAAIEERKILTEYDLAVATPGMLLRQGMASNYVSYTLRGQSVGSFSYSPPSVVTYFNEVPVGGLSQTSFFDLESIQVLKGPQGTLFGRNTTGGAVLYSAKRPSEEFNGYVKFVAGNYNNTEIETAVNMPLSDSVMLRIAGRAQERDGFQRNMLYGTEHNSVDGSVWRASLLFAPVDSRFENLLTVQVGDYGGQNGAQTLHNAYGADGAPTTYVDPASGEVVPLDVTMHSVHLPNAEAPGASSTNALVNAYFNGVEDYLIKRRTGQAGGFWDSWANLKDGDQSHDADHDMVSNITTFDVNDNVTIKNVYGYNKLMSNDCLDIDGGPYEWISIHGGPAPTIDGDTYKAGCYMFGIENWSNELQIQAEFGSWQYIFGVFYADEERPEYSPISIATDLSSLNIYYGAYDAVTDSKSKAIYAQASVDVNDKLSLAAGMRWTKEEVGITFNPSKPDNPRLLSAFQRTEEEHDDPSWELSASYDLTDELMIYGVTRGSWRTGAFNQTSGYKFPSGDYMRPEKTQDFEVGAKFSGLLGDIPTRFNVALYKMEVEDVQRTIYIVLPTGPAATAGNVNEAEVEGLELDGVFELTEWLQIGGSYAYTNPSYTDPRALYGGTTFYFGPYSDTPETSYSLYFRTSSALSGDKGRITFRGEFYAQDEWYYSQTADSASPNTTIPSYELINVRAEWSEMYGTNLSLAVFGRNLTEEKYYAGGNSNALTGGFNSRIPGQPRTFGLEITARF